MNLFAIETSTENISFSLFLNDKLVLDFNRLIKHSSSRLIYYIDRYIKKLSIDFKNIDAFVVGSGPGSFTGLRISHSIIKAFALVFRKPIISVGSFFSIAYNFKDKEKIAVIADARRNLIYAATFLTKENKLILKEKEKLVNLEEFILQKKDHFFVTYSENIREKVQKEYPQINFFPKNIWPKARFLLEFAKDKFRKSEFVAVENLEPIYLHPKTCQITIKKSYV